MRKGVLKIVVPCYNEEEVLHETNKRLLEVITNMEQSGKIVSGGVVYVDDGSRDKTWQIIDELSKEDSHVSGIKLAHNAGHQNALFAGLTLASECCDMAVSIDADLQDDTNAIFEMVDKYNEGAEVVYGVRRERTTDTWFKRNTALAFYKLMSVMGTDVKYNHADFRLMGSAALKALVAMPERNLFLRGMVRTLGFKDADVYYDRSERFAGESKYPLSKMMNFAVDGITSFSVKPLRLIFSFGIFFIFIAIVAIGYGLYSHYIGHTIPGWTSLLVSLWLIGGAVLLAIGVVGEYVGKIYKEVKRRPLYVIERTENLK
ncbi:MAG: glycosyltransferase family 2 protein [Paludibacteraceae bacterium]|nr:glycosyltransferase family 2 protein [Paludibacteraceae bacterium]